MGKWNTLRCNVELEKPTAFFTIARKKLRSNKFSYT